MNVPTTTTTTTEINVNVPTGIDAPRNTPMGLMSPKRGTLSVILRTFKAAVTTICRSSGFPEFRWQGRFYDHIVRNEGDLNRIRQYIMDNPQNWSDDEQNPAKQR